MLKEALAHWIAPSITGQVTLELRRGDDYTIARPPRRHMAYDPHKLSMEKVESFSRPRTAWAPRDAEPLGARHARFLINHLDATRALARAGRRPAS